MISMTALEFLIYAGYMTGFGFVLGLIWTIFFSWVRVK